MKDIEIHIGDVLRIRSWEDMKAEYGIDECGVILPAGEAGFHEEMCLLCGEKFTVTKIVSRRNEYHGYRSEEGVENRDRLSSWVILSWMLEPYEDNLESKIPSDDEIALLFS